MRERPLYEQIHPDSYQGWLEHEEQMDRRREREEAEREKRMEHGE